MDVYIYALCDPVTSECRYVGKTVNLRQRFYGHLVKHECNQYKRRWIDGLIARGLRPIMRILEVIENSDDEDWQCREVYWISRKRDEGCRLTNLDGGGVSGRVLSDETKQKLRVLNLGKTVSDEVRKKMSDRLKGVPFTKEHSAAIAKTLIGRPVSHETRQKISQANTGRKFSPETIARFRARKPTVLPPEHYQKLSALFTGQKMSEEQKQKLRKPKSLEARSKMSAARKGFVNSPEARAKISKANKGKKRTDETRARMKASWVNRPPFSAEVRKRMSDGVKEANFMRLSYASSEYISAA